ncbi:type VII secretion integral membrane protein EccD, partial [Mycobacterium colombiense]
MTAPHKVAFPARCAVNISYEKHLCSQVFPAGIPMEGFFEGMVELFDADLKRKGFDGIALPAGSYELHKINGVRLDINKSLDELGVQDGDTLVLVPRVDGESFEPQYESLSTGLAAMGKWLGRDGGDRMFAPVTPLTAAHTAVAVIAM